MSYELQIRELLKDNGGLKERVAKLERTVAFLLDQLKLTYVDKPDEVPFADVTALAHSGNKLRATRSTKNMLDSQRSDQSPLSSTPGFNEVNLNDEIEIRNNVLNSSIYAARGVSIREG